MAASGFKPIRSNSGASGLAKNAASSDQRNSLGSGSTRAITARTVRSISGRR
jgi:hypothetical protein